MELLVGWLERNSGRTQTKAIKTQVFASNDGITEGRICKKISNLRASWRNTRGKRDSGGNLGYTCPYFRRLDQLWGSTLSQPDNTGDVLASQPGAIPSQGLPQPANICPPSPRVPCKHAAETPRDPPAKRAKDDLDLFTPTGSEVNGLGIDDLDLFSDDNSQPPQREPAGGIGSGRGSEGGNLADLDLVWDEVSSLAKEAA